MRVLLVGEFSGLHYNLSKGLKSHGVNVTLLSYGDSWKKIAANPMLTSHRKGILKLVEDEINFRLLKLIRDIGKFDVVQFVNPLVTNTRLQLLLNTLCVNNHVVKRLTENAGKRFLLAAGDDHFYFNAIENHQFKYNPIDEALEMDWTFRQKLYGQYWKRRILRSWNKEMIMYMDGVIPMAYEYDIGYEFSRVSNKRPYIPFPLATDEIKMTANRRESRPTVAYTRTRDGFKGSKHILGAFSMVDNKKILCNVIEKKPLAEYLTQLDGYNIIVDQVNSYSYGYTALYSLAKGRIVISGAEPDVYTRYNLEKCPSLFNGIPDADQIKNTIEDICGKNSDFVELGEHGRDYVEKNHDAKKIAVKFLNEWSK